jgi:hypothetical protein
MHENTADETDLNSLAARGVFGAIRRQLCRNSGPSQRIWIVTEQHLSEGAYMVSRIDFSLQLSLLLIG